MAKSKITGNLSIVNGQDTLLLHSSAFGIPARLAAFGSYRKSGSYEDFFQNKIISILEWRAIINCECETGRAYEYI